MIWLSVSDSFKVDLFVFSFILMSNHLNFSLVVVFLL